MRAPERQRHGATRGAHAPLLCDAYTTHVVGTPAQHRRSPDDYRRTERSPRALLRARYGGNGRDRGRTTRAGRHVPRDCVRRRRSPAASDGDVQRHVAPRVARRASGEISRKPRRVQSTRARSRNGTVSRIRSSARCCKSDAYAGNRSAWPRSSRRFVRSRAVAVTASTSLSPGRCSNPPTRRPRRPNTCVARRNTISPALPSTCSGPRRSSSRPRSPSRSKTPRLLG